MRMIDGIWKMLTPALVALGSVATAGATMVEWGSSSSARSLLHVDSGGDPVAATINIELGIFDPGFDPQTESPATWFDAWITLDIASYNAGTSFFSSSYEADNPAIEGRQAYIWLFTDPNPTVGSEWALITDGDGQGANDWIFPAAAEDQTEMPLEWRVNEATEVLFGAIDSASGRGVFETPPPAGFELQTFGFAPPVPEPSTAAFLVIALGLGLRRRR